MRFLISFVSLGTFWWLLSGQTKPLLLWSGVVVCAAVAWLAGRMRLADEESQPIAMLPRLLAYAPWLLWQVILSNWDVIRRVWSPRLNIAPELIEVPSSLRTGFGRTTYANSITLTPGTVTVDVGSERLLVHALHDQAAAGLESGEMHARVARVEGQA